MSLAAVSGTIGVVGGEVLGAAYDPFTPSWHSAFWANDRNWVKPADGGAVTTWPNRGTNGTPLAQGTASSQPSFRSVVASLNNRSAVQGDGSNDFLHAAFTSVPHTFTMVVVANLGSNTSSTLFDSAATSPTTLFRQTTTLAMSAGTTITGGTFNTSPHLFVARYAGASSFVEVDGTQVISGNTGTNALTSGLRIMANRSSTSATFHNGHYAFVGLYAGALPSTDLADIEAWAASYYGLTIAA